MRCCCAIVRPSALFGSCRCAISPVFCFGCWRWGSGHLCGAATSSSLRAAGVSSRGAPHEPCAQPRYHLGLTGLAARAEVSMHGLNPHLKRVSWIAFLAGLTVFVLLIGYYGIGDIAAALVVAGVSGLAVIAAVHILPLVAEAMGWRFLFPLDKRPSFRTLLWGRWIGEAVDTILPALGVGGDLVRIRLFTKLGMSGSLVAASLVADLTLTLVTLIAFTLLGLVLLAFYVAADGVLLLLVAVLVGIVLVFGFYLAQRRGLFGILARLVENFIGPLDTTLLDSADAIDEQARRIYARRKDVLISISWLS